MVEEHDSGTARAAQSPETTSETPEPLGRVGSYADQVRCLRYQLSKYGWYRGLFRYTKRQATRWNDILQFARRRGTEEYRAQRSTPRGWQWTPFGWCYRASPVVPKPILVAGSVISYYLRLFVQIWIGLWLPILSVLMLVALPFGLLEGGTVQKIGLAVGTVVAFAGFTYWMQDADTTDHPLRK